MEPVKRITANVTRFIDLFVGRMEGIMWTLVKWDVKESSLIMLGSVWIEKFAIVLVIRIRFAELIMRPFWIIVRENAKEWVWLIRVSVFREILFVDIAPREGIDLFVEWTQKLLIIDAMRIVEGLIFLILEDVLWEVVSLMICKRSIPLKNNWKKRDRKW